MDIRTGIKTGVLRGTRLAVLVMLLVMFIAMSLCTDQASAQERTGDESTSGDALEKLQAQRTEITRLEGEHATAFTTYENGFLNEEGPAAAERAAAQAVQDADVELAAMEADLLPDASPEEREEWWQSEKDWLVARQNLSVDDPDRTYQLVSAYGAYNAYVGDYDDALEEDVQKVNGKLAAARKEVAAIEAAKRKEQAAKEAEEAKKAEQDPADKPAADYSADEPATEDPAPTPPPTPVPDDGGGFNPLTFFLLLLFLIGIGVVLVVPRLKNAPGGGRIADIWSRYMKPKHAQTKESFAGSTGSDRPTMGSWSDKPIHRPKPDLPPPPDFDAPLDPEKIITRRTPPPVQPTSSPRPSEVPRPDNGSSSRTPAGKAPPRPKTPTTENQKVPAGKAPQRPSPTTPNVPVPDGVPHKKNELSREEKQKLLTLGKSLKERVIGQDYAADALGQSLLVQRVGKFGGERPESFLFCGTTGVGKTEIAKALADEMFGGEEKMIRIDMGEYGDKISANKFAGAPPGYIGHEEGGQLTNAMLEDSERVVLLDEIEKAHPDLLNPLLGILDDGRLTSGKGELIDFTNAVVIMTSNAGAKEIRERFESGASGIAEKEMKQLLVAGGMRPEFPARIGEIITFRPLRKEDVRKIAKLMLLKTAKKFREEHSATLTFSDAAVGWVAEKGYEPENGARPLRGVIRRHVENSLSKSIARDEITPGMTIRLDVAESGDELVIETVKKTPREEVRR